MVVDHYLRYLKWKEYKRTAPVFLPSRPIEETLENITTSYLYKVLKRLPKGGDMHTHEGLLKHRYYTYICMYECMHEGRENNVYYVCMYVCMCVFACMYVCVCACMHAMYVLMYICMYLSF